MTDHATRLREARKQIRIVADELDDTELVAELHRASELVESARSDLTDRIDDD